MNCILLIPYFIFLCYTVGIGHVKCRKNRKEDVIHMFTEQKLEQRYGSLSSEMLHTIRDEYKWAADIGGIHNDEQLKYIEKVLTIRGESLEVRTNRKILFLCSCGQSRIVNTDIPEDKIKMFIFDQYTVPCSKCRNVNLYTWKYMD